jgi:hypothetical protein
VPEPRKYIRAIAIYRTRVMRVKLRKSHNEYIVTMDGHVSDESRERSNVGDVYISCVDCKTPTAHAPAAGACLLSVAASSNCVYPFPPTSFNPATYIVGTFGCTELGIEDIYLVSSHSPLPLLAQRAAPIQRDALSVSKPSFPKPSKQLESQLDRLHWI